MSPEVSQKNSTYLCQYGWLSSTPTAFQDAVLKRSDLMTFAPKQPIYSVGDNTGGIYGVLDGQVELHLQMQSDAPTVSHIAGPGFWGGDLAAVTGRPRRIGIVSRGSSRIFRLTQVEMGRIMEAEPTGWRYLALLSAMNLALAIDIVDRLRRNDPLERVALTLLNMLSPDPADDSIADISQATLGSLTALSRGSVNAAMAALERRGWVKRGYAVIEVLDREALRDFAFGD